MSGIDLKMTREDAMKLLASETDAAIKHIRDAGEDLAVRLTLSEAAAASVVPDVKTADAAAIIDFDQTHELGGRAQLNLSLNGYSGGYADLARGLPKGSYRAVILIHRVDR